MHELPAAHTWPLTQVLETMPVPLAVIKTKIQIIN